MEARSRAAARLAGGGGPAACDRRDTRARPRVRRAAALALLAGVACTDLTRVEAPDVVQPAALENPAGAVALRAGALGRFAAAYARQVDRTGLMTDEFLDAATAGPTVDRRAMGGVDDLSTSYPFAQLSLARVDLVNAVVALRRDGPTPAARIAELYAHVAAVETMLAENLCAPVPLGVVEGGVPTASPPRTRAELLDAAVAHADSGLAVAAPTDSVRHLLRLVRARALLQGGAFDAAEQAVAAVPLTFAYQVRFSSAILLQQNRLGNLVAVGRVMSVADREGGNGLPFVTGRDPRVVTTRMGTSNAGIAIFSYPGSASTAAPLPLASGVEAGLLRAEAALRRGDVSAWAAALNDLRQRAIVPAMPALSADSSTAATPERRIAVHFRERAFWLFGSGRRHGDLRRMVRQYGLGAETVFPTGVYVGPAGGTFGTDVTFPLPTADADPAFRGCEDVSA